MVLRKIIKKPALNPHKNCLLNHHISSHMVHAHSENDITPATSQNYI